MKEARKNLILAAAIFIVVTVISLFRGGYSNIVRFTEDSFSLEGPEELRFVCPLSDIVRAELAGSYTEGEILGGEVKNHYSYGPRRSAALGEYTVSVYDKCESCIVMTVSDGRVLVFNYDNSDNTEALYEAICALPGVNA